MDVPLVSVQPYSVCSIFTMDMSSQKRLQFSFLSYPTTRRGHSADIVTFLLSGYIGEFEIVDDHRSNKIVIQLNGRLNKTGVISPRFNIQHSQIESWVNLLLPARGFGIIILVCPLFFLICLVCPLSHWSSLLLDYLFWDPRP
jgi:hypothetical protein